MLGNHARRAAPRTPAAPTAARSSRCSRSPDIAGELRGGNYPSAQKFITALGKLLKKDGYVH